MSPWRTGSRLDETEEDLALSFEIPRLFVLVISLVCLDVWGVVLALLRAEA